MHSLKENPVATVRRCLAKVALSLVSAIALIGCKLDFPEQW